MLSYDYPLLGVFWTMLWFFLFFIWIWLLIMIFSDIFRNHEMSGVKKTLWVIFVIVLPFLGILMYLIFNGKSMQERGMRQAAQQQEDFRQYVKETAADTASPADQLAKLADLKQQGILTDAEFEAQKTKILAS
jgi:Phospholipase_D-nuclease N-terminal/Short C-terminal domain